MVNDSIPWSNELQACFAIVVQNARRRQPQLHWVGPIEADTDADSGAPIPVHFGTALLPSAQPLLPGNAEAIAPPALPPELQIAAILSPRHRQVLAFLLRGFSEKQIARHLTISVHTVHIYSKQLYRRFEVNSRGELLALFIRKDAAPACPTTPPEITGIAKSASTHIGKPVPTEAQIRQAAEVIKAEQLEKHRKRKRFTAHK